MMSTKIDNIRNFSIIAHIDHGKSTLADRLLEVTGTTTEREKKDRILDTLELEQEKGITIKLQTARMNYKGVVLNLIDTPGHVDFSYEVSRSLAASEGALLLVDATQGIQAQTFTTIYKALEHNLEIIPVLNKVDLPYAEVDRVRDEVCLNFGFEENEVILASAKTGKGVTEILDAIVDRLPSPVVDDQKTKAMIFDSFYHEHKGVVILVKMVSGEIGLDDSLWFINSEVELEPLELGYLRPQLMPQKKLSAGEVGYIATGLKDIRKIHVGDTVTLSSSRQIMPLPGYKQPKPMVFASIYPVDADDFFELQEGLEKLALNDAALAYSKETSQALGSGYNCGFLGLLHLEISQERLEREFGLSLITTTPSVEYHLKLTTDDMSKLAAGVSANFDDDGLLHIRNAAEYPDPTLIDEIYEPWAKLDIITPEEYIGGIMEIAEKKRAEYISMEYLSENSTLKKHVLLKYDVPMSEIMTDFFDKLKSVTQGYGSMDYEFDRYKKSDIVKISVLVNKAPVEPLSFLAHRENAEDRGRKMVENLTKLIPKQQFKVPIQAAIGGNVIARETISAYKKDVTAKLYGGDVTRKKKLREKQRKGKQRLKKFGSVEIPKSAFLAALSS